MSREGNLNNMRSRFGSMDIGRTFGAEQGLTCLVGAGGKKTTLYALANHLNRAVVTATVRIPIFDRTVESVVVTTDPLSTVQSHTGPWPLGVVPEREDDRYTGYDPDVVNTIATGHDGPVLVKADGARTREFKAPGEHEPRIPSETDVVILVASVEVVGQPLAEEHVHRPARVAALTDLESGDTVTKEAVATVLAHPDGGCKGVPPEAAVVALLNKVDDEDDAAIAREIARLVFDRLDRREHRDADRSATDQLSRVVLARMIDETVVDVVSR